MPGFTYNPAGLILRVMLKEFHNQIGDKKEGKNFECINDGIFQDGDDCRHKRTGPFMKRTEDANANHSHLIFE